MPRIPSRRPSLAALTRNLRGCRLVAPGRAMRAAALVAAIGLAWAQADSRVAAQAPGPAADLILFSSDRSGEFQLYVMSRDGSNQRRVANTPGKAFENALSCNGRIATVVEPPGSSEHFLWTVNLDGTDLRRITDGPGDHMPTWRPDGFQIAFSSDPPEVDIHLINADGSARRRVTNDPAAEFWPHWSPAAGLFAIHYGPRNGPSDVYTVSDDGSTYRRVTTTGDATEPRWGPGGGDIVFSRRTGGDSDIALVNVATGAVRTVVGGTTYDHQPTWMPDGSRILFVRGRETGGDAEIWSVRPDGSDARNLTQAASSHELWPATACLSPDLPTPTATPTATKTPTTTSTPRPLPTPTVTASPPAAVVATCVCAVARSRVPAAIIADALANPLKYYGWRMLRDPDVPAGPKNRLRTCLSIQHRNIPYHPYFNRPIWRAGCP